MKFFRIEPTYKKSVIEWTIFKREVDGKPQFLRKELGWRWGEFLIRVPDTVDEKLEWAQGMGYDNVETCLEEYYGLEDITEDSLLEALLPDTDDDYIELEDYEHEMLSTWDGCWDDWSINLPGQDDDVMDEEEKDSILEEVQIAYDEDYEEGVEALGWEFIECEYDITCNVTVQECDEYGEVLEAEQEEE
jgi:hypothetical protein